MARRKALWLTALLLVTAAGWACSRSATSYYESGNRYFDQKRYKEAIVEYRRAIQKDLKFGDAHYKLAEALWAVGDMGAAREYLRAADELPANKEAQLKAGAWLLLADQFQDAEERAKAALEIDPNYVDALILLANATARLKGIDAAIPNIEDAIQLNPLESRTYQSLGALQQAKGDMKSAEATFRKAVELDPKSVPARLGLANFFWSARRSDEAEQELKRAAELDPKSVQINRLLARFYLLTGRVAQAEPYLKAMAETTNDWRQWMLLADYYSVNNREAEATARLEAIAKEAKDKDAYSEAQSKLAAIKYAGGQQALAHQMIDEVLKRDPNSVTGLLVGARFLISEKKYDEALGLAQKAAAADPRSAAAQYTMGTIYMAKSDADGAMKAFNQVLQINPQAAAAQVELARLYLALGAGGDPAYLASAAQYAEQAVKNWPANPQVRLLYIRTLLARGNVAQAEAEMKPLLATSPNTAAVQSELGTLLLNKNDLAGARRAYETALTLDPTSNEALSGLVSIDLDRKQASAARARIDARLANNPKDAAALLLSAKVYLGAGDLDKAEQAFLKLLQEQPGALTAYQALAEIYITRNRLDEAREKYEELARRQPKPVMAQTMIGIVLQAQGKAAEAQRRFEMVLEIDPRAAVASNNLAFIYAEQGGNLDTALQLARTAKEQLPDVAQVNDTLGWIYVKKGLYSVAVPLLKAAADKDPKKVAFHYHLGMAYFGSNEKANAKAALERALKMDPNFDGSAEARKVLAEIG
jgi:tetratricopeptide (TPR) repeat protein